MKAKTSRKGRDALSNYELTHRVHVGKVYPSKAPNGSTIILYGHENGVRICWRGGRPLKRSQLSKHDQQRMNGIHAGANAEASNSDDDSHRNHGGQRFTDTDLEAEFESDEEEVDVSSPAPPIIQTLDLALHTSVLHISVPPVPSPGPLRSTDTIPSIFQDKIVFAVACADCSVRVITVPRTPPSHARKAHRNLSKHESVFGEEIMVIGSQIGHQSIPRELSITWTARNGQPLKDQDEEEMDVDGSSMADLAKSRSSLQFSRSATQPPTEFDFIIASHSTEATGVLHIFRAPLKSEEGEHSFILPPSPPFQTIYLPSPAVSLAFSPSAFPNKRHTQLLVSDSKGSIRIYDPFLSANNNPEENPELGKHHEGTWLASFSTSFKAGSRPDFGCSTTARRKRIVDAQWATGGRSVVTLLADGEWGVWDIENAAPSNKKAPTNNTSFAISGFVGNSANRASNTVSNTKSSSTLVPMTPNTRRTKQDTFIHGSPTSSSPSSSHNARGGVSVVSLPPTSGGVSEDSVIIWYANDVYRIPNLAQFWARTASGSAGGLYGPGLTRVEGVDLRGQMISSIDQLDISTSAARVGTPRDLLISAEYRLLVLARVGARRDDGDTTSSIFGRTKEQDHHDDVDIVDKALLARGELDLGGMDRLLENMAGAGQSTALFPRKVGFAE